MKRLALIPILMLLTGCKILFFSGPPPHLVDDENHEWAGYPEHWQTVRTIQVPMLWFDPVVLRVLMFGNDEVLEIKCETLWLHTPMIGDSAEWQRKVEKAHTQECDFKAIDYCQLITGDDQTTIRRVAYLPRTGDRHRGPAVYVQCLTPAEFRIFIKENEDRVTVPPEYASEWKRYRREVGASEENKHSIQ
jgi:hypothetical protein